MIAGSDCCLEHARAVQREILLQQEDLAVSSSRGLLRQECPAAVDRWQAKASGRQQVSRSRVPVWRRLVSACSGAGGAVLFRG